MPSASTALPPLRRVFGCIRYRVTCHHPFLHVACILYLLLYLYLLTVMTGEKVEVLASATFSPVIALSFLDASRAQLARYAKQNGDVRQRAHFCREHRTPGCVDVLQRRCQYSGGTHLLAHARTYASSCCLSVAPRTCASSPSSSSDPFRHHLPPPASSCSTPIVLLDPRGAVISKVDLAFSCCRLQQDPYLRRPCRDVWPSCSLLCAA